MFKKVLLLSFLSMLILTNTNIADATTPAKNVSNEIPLSKGVVVYKPVQPMEVVQNPKKYLNQNIKMNAIFDKFSIVGLDYKPAFRSSEKYILFLIRKCETDGHIIPLSEMKLFLTRKKAEKFIDLDAGDEIEITGKIFSAALGDPWIDVDELKIIKSKPKKKDN